jgi:hypothetical protein
VAAASADPDSDLPLQPIGFDAEVEERSDDPGFEAVDVVPDVAPALLEIEEDVADPLTGSVIGVAAAAAAS